MKFSKKVIAVLLAAAIVFCFSACKSESGGEATSESAEATVQVTDKNGEPVTDKNGKAVTEKVTKADSETKSETKKDGKEEKSETAAEKAENKKDKKDKSKKDKKEKETEKETTTSKPKKITPPKAPKNIQELKVENITENAVTLKWDSVECDGYQIAYSSDNQVTWEYLEKAFTKNQYSVKGLESYTDYAFRVRAFNKNEAGTKTCEWVIATAKTKSVKTERKIKVTVLLPAYSNSKDNLVVSINDKVVKEKSVRLDGSKYSFTTDKKYKDLVSITAEVEGVAVSRTVETDKDEITIDISSIGIQEMDGEDD